MSVSVVITSYNHGEFLHEAISSALSQTLKPQQVIVVDDCSTDNSREVIRSFGEKITAIYNETNLGGAATTAIGVAKAYGKYVAILNSDDFWAPTKLETQMAAMVSNGWDACFSFVNVVDHNSRLLENAPSHFSSFDRSKPLYDDFLVHFFLFGNFLCHSSVLATRELFDLAGPYDNRYKQLPDLDMWIRFAKKGQIGVIEDRLVNYRYLGLRNTSTSLREDVLIRTRFEHMAIFCQIFCDLSIEKIQKHFANYAPTCSKYRDKNELIYFLLEGHPDFSLSEPAAYAALKIRWENGESKNSNDTLHHLTGTTDIFRLRASFVESSNEKLPTVKQMLWRIYRNFKKA